MRFNLRRASCLPGLFCLVAGLSFSQNWKTADTLPGVDLQGLSAKEKASALKLLRERDCSCACGMKVAECRVGDRSCSYSNGLASAIVNAIKQGKSASEALAAADASKWAHVTQQQAKLLEDAIEIPTAGAPETGRQNAPITLVEFSDFQCPYCSTAVGEIQAVLKAYPSQVRLIFKQFPLDFHPQADLAAAAALAAHKQGKFWPMHDAMFSGQADLSRRSLLAMANTVGLDMKRFEEDLDSTAVRESVVRDVQDGDRAGVQGTPTIFVNGQKYNGPIEISSLKPILDSQLKHPASAVQSASGK